MTFDSPAKPESDANPIVRFEHDELPTITSLDGTGHYPFGEKKNLIFASVKEEQRWKTNVSSLERGIDERKPENEGNKIIRAVAAVGLFLSCYWFFIPLLEIILTGKILEHGWKSLLAAISFVGILYLMDCYGQADEKNRRKIRSGFTYRVFNLRHPMFPKNNPLVQYGTTIFTLRNKRSRSGEKQNFEEGLDTSSTPLDTGESTHLMLEEYDQYLDMAGKFAKLWPDADQPTRAAIAKDMAAKAEKLRTACANYQTDADQMAKINREKQDYLAQQEAETKTIMAKAKAEEAADAYRRVKAQYDS